MVKRVLILVFLFLALYIIDQKTCLLEPVEKAFLVVSSSLFNVRAHLVNAYRCFLEPVETISLEPGSGDVLTKWGDGLVVKGKAGEGDVVLNEDGRFVGYVELVLGDSFVVRTVNSKNLRINVEIVSSDGVGVEGILIGGYPPIVEIPEEIDITGWDVYISRAQDMGNFLRANGKGYIGRILGKDGDHYAVQVEEISDRLTIIRR